MSSKHKQSHAKKKRTNGRGGRRKRNLIKGQHYYKPTLPKRKIKWSVRKYDSIDKEPAFKHLHHAPYYQINLKKPHQLDEETLIKYYLKALQKDVRIYKELKQEYGNGGGVSIVSQITNNLSKLEEKLKESNLPYEQIRKFEKDYEYLELELNSLGFYD